MNHTAESLRTICQNLDVSVSALADAVGIQRSALSRILNGKDDMTEKMLGKLLDYQPVTDTDASALAQDWTIDHWPKRARDLLMITRRGYAEPAMVRETPAVFETDLDRTISELRNKARGNPALARALRNFNRTLDGHVDVID